ncbi:MAG: hypothetical protein IPP91_09775 [Betaproteobacteria bacterium]|nr:hypothetical protein [Betaproteobacteria bacterium]
MPQRISRFEVLTGLSRRDRLLIAIPALVLLAASFWLAAQFLTPMPPRRIVLAAGPEQSALHALGLRYREILARDGVTVEVRATRGAGENADLLRDPVSGVDAAIVVAGTISGSATKGIINLSNLLYAPVWCLYRGPREITRLPEFRGKRIAVGAPGSGIATAIAPLLAANGISADSATLLHVSTLEALRALKAEEVDALFTGEGPSLPEFRDALLDSGIRLMDFQRADAYSRRFPHITRLDLPAGTLDMVRNIPDQNVELIGTTAMMAAREGLHPTVIDLFVDAAREIHGGQGYFGKRGEFPHTIQVDDVPVSKQAVLYARSGPSFLRRYLPLWLADFLQRVVTLGIPVAVVVFPLVRWLPAASAGMSRQRIYRWYADLRLVERRIEDRESPPVLEELLRELDRIDDEAARVRGSILQAKDNYDLRAHIQVVRDAVLARTRRA